MSTILQELFPRKTISVLFWTLVGLSLADFALTTAIISVGGEEANPYLNLYIERFGPIGILIAKIIPFLMLAFALFFKWDKVSIPYRTGLKRSLIVLNYMYGAVILYSIYILGNLLS